MEMQNSNMDIYTCKAKTLYDGKWITGYYLQGKYWFDDEPMHFIFQANEVTVFPRSEFTDAHEIDPSTLCRYTGLNDQHDEPIFEHDWVHTEFGRTCEVVWFSSPSYVGWDLIPVSDFDDPPPNKCTLFSSENLEVIANRFDFDNTNLMED